MDELYNEINESDVELTADEANIISTDTESAAIAISSTVESVSAAMASMAESVSAAMANMAETVQKIVSSIDISSLIDSLLKALNRVFAQDRIKKLLGIVWESTQPIIHAFLHWITFGCRTFRRKLKGQKRLLYALVLKAAILYPCVKALVIAFLERTVLILSINLRRIQDRGTSEESEGNYVYAVVY